MIARVISTMTADAKAGQLDTIGAVAWYQGESDATNPTMAADYRANLISFITALRLDLPMSPGTPIILVKESLASTIALAKAEGKCGTTVNCTAWAKGDAQVREADDWAAANLANVLTVDTLGLPRVPDYEIHLTDTSELTVGGEIAKAIERVMPKPDLPRAALATEARRPR